MYFHPLMSYAVHREELVAACRDLVQLWFDGVHSQNSLQLDAVLGYTSSQRKNLQSLADATSQSQVVECFMTAAAQLPLHAWETSLRCGELAAALQRRTADLLQDHTAKLSAPSIAPEASTNDKAKRASLRKAA